MSLIWSEYPIFNEKKIIHSSIFIIIPITVLFIGCVWSTKLDTCGTFSHKYCACVYFLSLFVCTISSGYRDHFHDKFNKKPVQLKWHPLKKKSPSGRLHGNNSEHIFGKHFDMCWRSYTGEFSAPQHCNVSSWYTCHWTRNTSNSCNVWLTVQTTKKIFSVTMTAKKSYVYTSLNTLKTPQDRPQWAAKAHIVLLWIMQSCEFE